MVHYFSTLQFLLTSSYDSSAFWFTIQIIHFLGNVYRWASVIAVGGSLWTTSENVPFYFNTLLLKLPSCCCFSRHFKWHLSKGSFWSSSKANSASLQWWQAKTDPSPFRSYVTSPYDFGDW